MEHIDLEALNPGIRKTVGHLRARGFETVNSGDGVTHQYPDCDRPYSYVLISLPPEDIARESRRVLAVLTRCGFNVGPVGPSDAPDSVWIAVDYSPFDECAYMEIGGVHDRYMKEPAPYLPTVDYES